ncbi:hypothetical protein, partial [Enterococcus rotai]|uniref:hypothetical protein n=1 Tax=Enterococcus rotai TaxID=118060 RepID=UPI0035C75A8E
LFAGNFIKLLQMQRRHFGRHGLTLIKNIARQFKSLQLLLFVFLEHVFNDMSIITVDVEVSWGKRELPLF